MDIRFVTASVNDFFSLLAQKNSAKWGCYEGHVCYGRSQFARVKELFEKFRQKYPHFNLCSVEEDGNRLVLSCAPTDDSKGYLISSMNKGEEFGMSIIRENMGPDYVGINCKFSRRASNEMTCKGTGSLSSYSFIATDPERGFEYASCWETADTARRSCGGGGDQNLYLFERLLKSTPEIPKKITNPSSSRIRLDDLFPPPTPSATGGWKNVVGAVSAIGFSCLTYKEARAWKEQHPKASGWRALGYAGLAAGSIAFASKLTI